MGRNEGVNQSRTIGHGLAKWCCALLLGLLPALPATAQILDDIEVRTSEGVAEIRLVFTRQVRYLKHFPPEQGQLIKLYLQAVSLDGFNEIALEEYKRTPAIPLVPPFTISYSTVRSCFAVRDPLCLDIQFDRPVRYNLSPGRDGRSILIVVLPDNAPQPGTPAKANTQP